MEMPEHEEDPRYEALKSFATQVNAAKRLFMTTWAGLEFDRYLALTQGCIDATTVLTVDSDPNLELASVDSVRLALSAAHEAWKAAMLEALKTVENQITDAINDYVGEE